MRSGHLILLLVLALLISLDVATTSVIINMGGREFNPYLIGIAGNLPMHAGVALLALCSIAGIAYYSERRLRSSGLLPLASASGIFTYAVMHNLAVLLPAYLYF